MKSSQIYQGAIGLGVIALIVGILFIANLFGTHHILPYLALGVGVVLLIIGIAGMVLTKRNSAA